MLAVLAVEAPTWLTGWVGAIAAILGLLGLLASAAAYLRATYAKATVATLAESNAALKERVELLTGDLVNERADRAQEKVDHATQRAADMARLAAVEVENATLRELVQGKADLDRLVLLVNDNTAALRQDLSVNGEKIDSLLRAQGASKDEIVRIKGMLTRALSNRE